MVTFVPSSESESDGPRWGIWIDIEGFSKLWGANHLMLKGLGRLAELVLIIGRNCFPTDGERLFAHQIGDGFYIASDFHEKSLDRCAAIAITLMRAITEAGCMARASISEGELADYSGCLPTQVREAAAQGSDKNFISLGSGLMTLQSVMGSGLIAAVVQDKAAGKGSLLSIPKRFRNRISKSFRIFDLETNPDLCAIDWVHSQSPMIDAISNQAMIDIMDGENLELYIRNYISRHEMLDDWSNPTLMYAGLSR